MFYRKIQEEIERYFRKDSNKVMLIDGARQIGKSYIIRYMGQKMFQNYIELNMVEDYLGDRLFEKTKSVSDFYLQVSMLAGDKMDRKENTLIFLDEIQQYPHLLALLKFLKRDDRFTYIASGSLLGVALADSPSIPMGSVEVHRMYPMDFEEFLLANGVGGAFVSVLRQKFERRESLDESIHRKVMDFFRRYLLVGGLPDSIQTYLDEQNIAKVRAVQSEIRLYYGEDASKYDKEYKLKIKRIYDMIPSTLENKKKRIVIREIEDKKGARYASYQDEFDYLIHAGIALDVKAISTPVFPLIENSGKNLLKLYLNDVGILTGIYYRNNVRAILDGESGINLGTVYESVVAQELKAHGFALYYYDNKSKGEVDFLIDDYNSLSVVPIEVKSGKDYTVHSALDGFMKNKDYGVKGGFVLSNEREVFTKEGVTYLPIYDIMFIQNN